MTKLVNRAKMTTATTGTGTITLGSAVDGYQTFASAGVVNGDLVRYVIEDFISWEIGTGTFSSGTLTRTPSESSNGGAAINLSGEAVVYLTATADDINNVETAAKLATARTISLSGDVTGSVSFDGSANATITAVVVDDSHNHIISNVDGLQTALDAKFPINSNAPTDLNSAGQGIWRINTGHTNTPSEDVSWSTLVSFDNSSDTGFQLLGDYNGSLWYRGGNAPVYGGVGAFTAWHKVWSDQNDGSGSGLDADLLDGQHGSYYLDYNNATNTPTIGNATITVSAGSGMTGGGSFTTNQTTNGTITINHLDTSSAGSVNNSNGVVIQDVTLDGYGHVTALGSIDLDSRYYTEIEADARYLRKDTNDTSVGYIAAEGFVNTGTGSLSIFNPQNANYATTTATVTGAIKITLPVSWTNTMMRMSIRIYEYATNEGFDVVCGGYNAATPNWVNPFAYILGNPNVNRNFNIRFGHDGTKCCIYIGETTSTWSYPQVAVTQFVAGYSNYAAETWNDGWDIGFATTLGTIYATISNSEVGRYVDNQLVFHDGYHPNADTLTTARTISLTGDVSGSVSFNGSANVSITTTVADDSHEHKRLSNQSDPSVAPDYALEYLNLQGTTTDTPTTDWYNVIRMGHGDPNTYYNNTLAMKMTGSGVGGLWGRTRTAGTAGSWFRYFDDNYHPNADKLTTARNIALSGDVTGSANFDGSANISITATVADDSHNHVISNVDGLQTALDGKQAVDPSIVQYRGTITSQDWNTFVDGTEAGFYSVTNMTGANIPPTYTYGLMMNASVSGQGKFQLYAPHNGSEGGNGLYYRSGWNTDYDAWAEIWHSNNDGTGSGLDADLLDGQHASDFALLSSPALTGTPTAPTAAVGTNTTQLATTAFVNAEIANDAPTKTGGGASGTWGISVTGNSGTATTLQTARTIALSGAATGTATSFNGSANITIPVTAINASNLSAGTVPDARLSGTYSGFTHRLDGSNTVFTTPNSGSTSTLARTVYGLAEYKSILSAQVGAIVFIAPNTTSTIMHQLEIAGMLYNQNVVSMTVQGYRSLAAWADVRKISTGTVDVQTRWAVTPDGKNCLILGDVGTSWSYPHFSIVRAMFSHSGVVDSYCSGWTVAVVTDLSLYTQLTSNIVDSTMVGSISGNAATATALQTARTINGVSFNGTANITVADSTKLPLTGGTLTGTVTAPTFNATSLTGGGFQGIDSDSATQPSFTWSVDQNTGMYRAAENVIGFTANGAKQFDVGVSYVTLPTGTTAQRPVTPVTGMMRYNTTRGCFEGYNGSNWVNMSPINFDDIGSTA